MTLNLEEELVATSYDPATKLCTYTLLREGRRWTVTIPKAELDRHGANRDARRNYLATRLIAAMQGLPDAPAGTQDDPAKPADWDQFHLLKAGTWYVNPADGALKRKPYE